MCDNCYKTVSLVLTTAIVSASLASIVWIGYFTSEVSKYRLQGRDEMRKEFELDAIIAGAGEYYTDANGVQKFKWNGSNVERPE